MTFQFSRKFKKVIFKNKIKFKILTELLKKLAIRHLISLNHNFRLVKYILFS